MNEKEKKELTELSVTMSFIRDELKEIKDLMKDFILWKQNLLTKSEAKENYKHFVTKDQFRPYQYILGFIAVSFLSYVVSLILPNLFK